MEYRIWIGFESLTNWWGFELLMNSDHNALWFQKSIKSVWNNHLVMRFFILLLSGVALAHFSGLLKIWKVGVWNFYRKIHYLVICVHRPNIFSVIANLPSLQHNVGSIIKVSFVSQRSGPNQRTFYRIFSNGLFIKRSEFFV